MSGINLFRFSQRSRKSLVGVHSDLVVVATTALLTVPGDLDFFVLEGLRSRYRQKQLVKEGASTTMNSRHLTGHAIDVVILVNGKPSWDFALYQRLAVHFKDAGRHHHIPLEWGGDWETLRDGPHYQLPWKEYPL